MSMTEKEKKMYGQYLQDGGKESLLNDINKAKAKREEGRKNLITKTKRKRG